MTELTLEMLDEAIKQIEKFDADNEIIGFKINPIDYERIRAKTKAIFVRTNNKMILQPPYEGLRLYSDDTIPPGYPEPIRKSTRKPTPAKPDRHTAV